MGFQAMVLGASGLVGGFVVKELLNRTEYDVVKVLVIWFRMVKFFYNYAHYELVYKSATDILMSVAF